LSQDLAKNKNHFIAFQPCFTQSLSHELVDTVSLWIVRCFHLMHRVNHPSTN